MISKLKTAILSRLTDPHGNPIGDGTNDMEASNHAHTHDTICYVCRQPIPDDEMVHGVTPVKLRCGEPSCLSCYNELEKEIPNQ